LMFRNAVAPFRFDQSVRISTQDPGSIRPCLRSHASTSCCVSRKSGLAAVSRETSITQAGAKNFSTAMASVALLSKALPVTQGLGASKCVSVCSAQEKLCQYPAGPRLSYLEISSKRNGQALPNSGGS